MTPSRYFLRLLAGLSVVLLSACVSPVVRLQPIPEPGKPFSLQFFSIKAPGPDWYVLDRKSQRIAFARFGREWKHSFGAEVQLFRVSFDYADLDEFAKQISLLRRSEQTDARFELIEEKESAVIFHDMLCTRSTLHARDRGARNRGQESYLLIQTLGLTCAHPEQKSVIIELRFFQRGREGTLDEALPEARLFFDSLQWQAGSESLLPVSSQLPGE